MRSRSSLIAALAAVFVLSAVLPALANGKAETVGAAQKVKLVYWMFGSPTREADKGLPADQWYITAAIKRFEKANPGIAVELLVLPDDTLGEKFKAAGIAKNGPDICNLWSGSMLTDNRQFLLPLDSYFSAAELADAASIEAVREGNRSDGTLLGMPQQNTVLTFYYNKSLLKKAGVDEAALPKDFSGLLSVFQKIKDAGITPLIVGDKEGYYSAYLLMTFYADLTGPGGIQKIVTGKTTFSADPDWLTASRAYQKLYTAGYTNVDAASLDSSGSMTTFMSGAGAMVTAGPWIISSAYEILKDDLGMFQIPPIRPSSPYARAVVGGAGQAFVVTSYSAHPAEAVRFMKFLISKEEQEARITVQDKRMGETCYKYVAPETFTDPFSRRIQEISRSGTVIYWPDNQLPSEVASEFYRLGPLVLSNKLTAEEFSVQLDAVLAKVLKK